MPFRFNARNAFLTYPHCDVEPSTLGEFLLGLRQAQYILVARENHSDGTPHLHALVQWIDKFNFRDERRFDFNGHHPNIQPARDVRAVHGYIQKHIARDNQPFYEYGTFTATSADAKWAKVAAATSEQEALSAALLASPRDFVLHNDKIREFARSKSRACAPYIPRPGEIFQLPESLASYMITEFMNPVGLCPWLLRERTVITAKTKDRIVLKPCCSSADRDWEKQAGHARSETTFTGGVCLTSQHSPPRRSISSPTT